jgi:tetratricopeptide (TPR) repeat protein
VAHAPPWPAEHVRRACSAWDQGACGPPPRNPRRDTPARHHSLEAAIAWSVALLTPEEQREFHRLGVFADGCTLEAAEAVTGNRFILDVLSSLVDKSLVRPPGGEDEPPRFRLFETIRAYALERLASSGELERTREAHAAFYQHLAACAQPELTGPNQRTWSRALRAELDNIRIATNWLLDRGELERALDLIWHIQLFFWAQGHVGDLRRFIDRFAAAEYSARLPDRERARLLFANGFLRMQSGDFDGATGLFEQAAAEARRLDDHFLLGQVMLNLGFCMPALGDIARGIHLLAEGETAFNRAGDVWGADMTRMGRGELALLEGDLQTAERLSTEFAASARSRGDIRSTAQGLFCVASVAMARGDVRGAMERFAESIECASEAATPEIIAYCALAWLPPPALGASGDGRRARSAPRTVCGSHWAQSSGPIDAQRMTTWSSARDSRWVRGSRQPGPMACG